MKLELYTNDLSPYGQRIELQLGMKRIPYSRIVPDRDFVRSDAFGRLNPIRKIPVLMLDGTAVPEAEVISHLLEELFPESSLLPEDPMDRVRARLLTRIVDIYVAASIVLLFNSKRDNRPEIVGYATETANRGLHWLENWMVPGLYCGGEARSIADSAMAPTLFFADRVLPEFGLKGVLEIGPGAIRYLEKVQADPDVAECFARMEAAMRERLG